MTYRWANTTVGQGCVVENTPYIAYSTSGEFIDIVSRYIVQFRASSHSNDPFSDNCVIGTYCDSSQKVCMQSKQLNVACGADKELVKLLLYFTYI